MKRIYSELLCAAFIGAFVSCTPEDEFIRSNGNLKSLAFAVSTSNDQSTSTRSEAESYVVDTFVLGDDTLALVCTVTDMDAPAPEAEEMTDTRGVPIYTRKGSGYLYNLEDVYGRFNVSGYIVDQSTGDLSPFYNNDVDDVDGTTTVIGPDKFENIPYKFDELEDEGDSEWEYWSPVGTVADHFFWWKDAHHNSQNYKLAFYAYSPTPDVTAYPWTPVNMKNLKDGVITFDYEVPVGEAGEASENNDATVQPDILVGATTPQFRDDLGTKTFSDGEHYFVELKFYHALSGVRFKATKELATNEHSLEIKSITLSGLKSKGTCTFNRAGNASGNNKSYDKISWAFATGSANDGSYTQEFGYTVPDITGADKFNDAKDQKDATLYGAEEGTGANKNFMLIPQSFGTATGVDSPDATITIKYTYNGVTKTKEAPLFQKNSSSTVTSYAWKAGKLYTYEIKKVVNEVDVAVDETFNASSNTKTHVNAKNIGTANAYVRAAVIANWVDGKGSVLAPLDFTSGTQLASFTGFNTGTGKWVKGDDGFYYYPNIVKPGNKPTVELFESLKAGTSPAEDTGAHLVVTVIVQGLEAGSSSSDYTTKKSDAESTWGISTGILTTTVETPI